MTGIFFYSILIFILLSIFAPSIYKYAYSCFIGRIVLVLLIIYFSKHSIILGLVFVAIIIMTSMPLYEGFLAKDSLVTSNYSIDDITNNQEVFNYFTNYYCAKDSNGNVATPLGPDTDKLNRWNDILSNPSSDNDSLNLAISNKILQQEMCSPSTSQYYQNYNNNWSATYNPNSANQSSISGCSTTFIDKNYWCGYWADIGQCSANPNYMLYSCAKSCNNVSGNTATGDNYVFNMPQCLPASIQTGICNDASIGDLVSSAQSISNNPNSNSYLQQDGQWMQNMYSQLCTTGN